MLHLLFCCLHVLAFLFWSYGLFITISVQLIYTIREEAKAKAKVEAEAKAKVEAEADRAKRSSRRRKSSNKWLEEERWRAKIFDEKKKRKSALSFA